MKKHVIILLATTLLFYACCTKKACPDNELPFIIVHFTSAGANDIVTLYNLKNNIVTDSAQLTATRDIELRPFDDFNMESAAGKSYIVSRNGKQDKFSDFEALFATEKIKCNECFPFGEEKQTIRTVRNFSYLHNSVKSTELRLELQF